MTTEAEAMNSNDPVIEGRAFGIGMNKTGTTSLRSCFDLLQLHPIAPRSHLSEEGRNATAALIDFNDYEPALCFAARYRAFEDRPWNVWQMYRRLDERFSGSRFILTVREPEKWWGSVERWIKVLKPGMEERYLKHLRNSSLEKDEMIAGYLRYNREVMDYFEGRDDLLVIDFEQEEGWGPLCEFLDRPIPDEPIPHRNRQFYDDRDLEERAKRERKKGETKKREMQEMREKRRKTSESKPAQLRKALRRVMQQWME